MKAFWMYSGKEMQNTDSYPYFDDNGDVCDGELLTVRMPDDEMESLENAGYGARFDAMMTNNAGMMHRLGMAALSNDEEIEEDTIERMKLKANDTFLMWSYYSSTEEWIFVEGKA